MNGIMKILVCVWVTCIAYLLFKVVSFESAALLMLVLICINTLPIWKKND